MIGELSTAWDSQKFEARPIGLPSTKEVGHPCMWRFWKRLLASGQSAIFDWSWYGRLIVERVEYGLSDGEYESSIFEINALEKILHDNQITSINLCLETDADTHRTRVLRRAAQPEKRWKVSVTSKVLLIGSITKLYLMPWFHVVH